MSMTEVRSFEARCIEPSSEKVYELHEVKYQVKDSGVWLNKTVQVLALDPMDAINYVRGGYHGL